MTIRKALSLLRILSNRRITSTPTAVFRELKRRRGQANGSVRNHLAGSIFSRLAMARPILSLLRGEHFTRHNGQWVLNTFLPPFPGAAFERLFTNLLTERQWSPVSAFIAITSRCPANCVHCSIKHRSKCELPTSTWLDVISQLHELGASIIGITGGEPLVHAELESLVAAIREGGAEPMIFTSGIGMTRERARRLKEAGLWALCVSLDRLDRAEIDTLRRFDGAGSAAIEALQIAKSAGLYTCINCVADQTVVEHRLYESLYRQAVEWGVDELRLIEPMPCGNLLHEPSTSFLSPEQIRILRQFHRRTNAGLSRLGRNSSRTKVCSFNELESPELFGCAGGTRHLFIDPSGEVCPCDFTPLSFGNITRERLCDIWNRMSGAMKHPRRHCMVHFQHEAIERATGSGIPAPVETSLETVAGFPDEELPDFLVWSRQDH